jgi:hypothetical protein
MEMQLTGRTLAYLALERKKSKFLAYKPIVSLSEFTV